MSDTPTAARDLPLTSRPRRAARAVMWTVVAAASVWLVVAATFPWWANALAQLSQVNLHGLPWRWLHMPWIHP